MTTARIVISQTELGVWSAFLNYNKVLELAFDRQGDLIQVGNIFRGKVVRLLPSINGAFVDIGVSENGFIHSRDVLARSELAIDENQHAERPIHLSLRVGELVLVQVKKESIGPKPFRLSSNLSLAGRNLVYIPGSGHIGISRKLDLEEDRQRLKSLLKKLQEKENFSDNDGFILRSNGKEASEKQLLSEMKNLQYQWREIETVFNVAKGIGLLYKNHSRAIELLRDRFGNEPLEVLVDDEILYKQARELFHVQFPWQGATVKKYQGAIPLFKKFGFDQVVDNIYKRVVDLRSGGTIVIELTEALVSIDVNSGGSEQKVSSSAINLKINLEAAREIAFQLRLRNLGGIIVIDFINMNSNADKEKLRISFIKLLEDDPAKTTVYDISALGLLEMSRQRSTKSLFEIFQKRCDVCDGFGLRRSVDAIDDSVVLKIPADNTSINDQ